MRQTLISDSREDASQGWGENGSWWEIKERRGLPIWWWVIKSPYDHSWLIGTAQISRPDTRKAAYLGKSCSHKHAKSTKMLQGKAMVKPEIPSEQRKALYLLSRKAHETSHHQSSSSAMGPSAKFGLRWTKPPWPTKAVLEFCLLERGAPRSEVVSSLNLGRQAAHEAPMECSWAVLWVADHLGRFLWFHSWTFWKLDPWCSVNRIQIYIGFMSMMSCSDA